MNPIKWIYKKYNIKFHNDVTNDPNKCDNSSIIHKYDTNPLKSKHLNKLNIHNVLSIRDNNKLGGLKNLLIAHKNDLIHRCGSYNLYKQCKKDYRQLYFINGFNWDTFEDKLRRGCTIDTDKAHLNRYKVYLDFQLLYKAMGHSIPTLDQIKKGEKLDELDDLIANYMNFLWNITHNLGKTLMGYLDSIIYVYRTQRVYINKQMFPWLHTWKKSCDRDAQNIYGKKVKQMKFAIINPQLEIMLKITRDRDARMAMLLQHRFVLRSEHYCKPKSAEKDCLRMSHIEFIYGRNPYKPTGVRIRVYHDKNHIFKRAMVRTVQCTCHTKWSCVVHELYKYVYGLDPFKIHNSHQPLIGTLDKPLTYDKMLAVTKAVVKQMGLDESNYGTHSFRAGGATELHCEGRDLAYIKEFGHWETEESVFGYLRPRNPDMYRYINTWEEYNKQRRKDSGLTGSQNIIINRIIHQHYNSLQ